MFCPDKGSSVRIPLLELLQLIDKVRVVEDSCEFQGKKLLTQFVLSLYLQAFPTTYFSFGYLSKTCGGFYFPSSTFNCGQLFTARLFLVSLDP